MRQSDQPPNTDSQLKTSAAMRHHKKKNRKINNYIIDDKENDKVLINAAIKLAEEEDNIIEKYNVTKKEK